MKHRISMLRTARVNGEKVRLLLVQLSLFDPRQAVLHNERFVMFPVAREPSPKEWGLIRSLDSGAITENVESSTAKRERQPNNIVEALSGSVDPSLLKQVKHSFDIIGNIAIIEVPEELASLKQPIAQGIIKIHKGIKTVLCKSGAVDGEFRVREYELVLGENNTETIHVEHGCRYKLDVTKVYFSPRLATEHMRVASQARANDVITDMFCGVGPFSILIAKLKRAFVNAIDINPEAINYLKTNCILNKVENFVHPMLGDARKLISENLKSTSDRIIMNLPAESLEFVDAACLALKPEGGVVHSYQFQTDPEPLKKAAEALRISVESANRRIRRVIEARLVKSVAPHEWHVAVDAELN
jgi:tRNA (guanine37-N1)-methyltransferase